MIETPKRTLLSRLQHLARLGVGQIREARGYGPIKIRRTVCLNRDHQRGVRSRWKWSRQSVRSHRRETNLSAARAVLTDQRSRGHIQRNILQPWVVRYD